MNDRDIKETIFTMVQEYLKSRTLIIWGSGATIPYGMPSMDELKKELKITEEGNLETILSEVSDEEQKKEYDQGIFNIINKRDVEYRESLATSSNSIQPLKSLISYFYEADPQVVNIVTTNYDCILEYMLSYYDFPYSDGFSGKEFSEFNQNRFKTRRHINLYKVHGSLHWSNERYTYYGKMMDGIFPNEEKYKKAYSEPYRTIISKSDGVITSAKCFLSLGFGFNDEHITPKIKSAIQNDKPIVVLAKKATDAINKEIVNAKKYVLIEKSEKRNQTKFTYRNNDEAKEQNLDGNYWELNNFIKILTNRRRII